MVCQPMEIILNSKLIMENASALKVKEHGEKNNKVFQKFATKKTNQAELFQRFVLFFSGADDRT